MKDRGAYRESKGVVKGGVSVTLTEGTCATQGYERSMLQLFGHGDNFEVFSAIPHQGRRLQRLPRRR